MRFNEPATEPVDFAGAALATLATFAGFGAFTAAGLRVTLAPFFFFFELLPGDATPAFSIQAFTVIGLSFHFAAAAD